MCLCRSAKSLLLRPDPLRALQHRRHPAGHSCQCSEWRHHLFPYFCHSVSCSSLAPLIYALLLALICCTYFFHLHEFHIFCLQSVMGITGQTCWVSLFSFFYFVNGHIQTAFAKLGHSYALESFCIVSCDCINMIMSVVCRLMHSLLCLPEMSGRTFAHPLKLMWKSTAW